MSVRCLTVLLMATTLASCASATLTESGQLSSYAGLQTSNGVLTRAKVRAEKDAVLAARAVSLTPAVVAAEAAASGLSPKELRLVGNAIDRALCRDLSRRFVMVDSGQPADLVLTVAITRIEKTDTTAAGASVVTGIGSKVAGAVTGAPVPSMRIPIGLGGLSVEAEARDRTGHQVAALIWARGADMFTTKARVASDGDAHQLAAEFAADFAKLIVTGDDPMAASAPSVPSTERIGEYFGAEAKSAACRRFGKDPGLGDTLGGAIGLPPEWTDKGPADP
ncbi:DUF3313 domain-containing protein [Rhodoplanes sp. TEM]|uniref:DUF3313 domain-containing protein n=1 Tax=Rhodoplanes tepidamans TaxID=200616 RepID=A0ABT5JAJ9_RHOTP|nr:MULTISPECIES: DUF3313 domain-containing protein [Rhodoplanes]MDC7786593.1 DUF3313 domain-containing protein [Rhodoplanes tepidamans]MDC7987587.1 DUF3313 domain-containing protein [Rhodoplanes sp. TEM]MDQ0357526.1 hypothetical protein [Rhodoplanes tepidamans]